jgi:mercuric ion transport protein
MSMTSGNKPLVAASLAAIGASACCILPLVLLTLGIGGAWMSNLTAMTPYSPYFTAFTVAILAWVFYNLYIKPRKCKEDEVCANPNVLKRQRLIFWLVSVLLIAMVTFPYYAEYVIS